MYVFCRVVFHKDPLSSPHNANTVSNLQAYLLPSVRFKYLNFNLFLV